MAAGYAELVDALIYACDPFRPGGVPQKDVLAKASDLDAFVKRLIAHNERLSAGLMHHRDDPEEAN